MMPHRAAESGANMLATAEMLSKQGNACMIALAGSD
jgi:hypothetical protein